MVTTDRTLVERRHTSTVQAMVAHLFRGHRCRKITCGTQRTYLTRAPLLTKILAGVAGHIIIKNQLRRWKGENRGTLVACMQGSLLCSLVESVHKHLLELICGRTKQIHHGETGDLGYHSSPPRIPSPQRAVQSCACVPSTKLLHGGSANSCELDPRPSSLFLPTHCAIAD